MCPFIPASRICFIVSILESENIGLILEMLDTSFGIELNPSSPRKTSAGESYIVVVSQQVPRPRSSDALYEGIYEQFVARKDPAPRKTTPTGQQKS